VLYGFFSLIIMAEAIAIPIIFSSVFNQAPRPCEDVKEGGQYNFKLRINSNGSLESGPRLEV